MTQNSKKSIIIITGASGKIGSILTKVFQTDYQVVGFDKNEDADIAVDFSSTASLDTAFKLFKEQYGNKIAAVIHLAAYFDFTGEESPLYKKINVNGTKKLLEILQDYEVERFIFASSMLVHAPGEPGEVINEKSALGPTWAYPKSKLKTEQVIQKYHGDIPYLIVRLAGLYDDTSCVPTLAHQIARTYERNPKSNFYAGDVNAGQSFIHQDDLVSLFQSAIKHRNALSKEEIVLAGEPEALGYKKAQELISTFIHDESARLVNLPTPIAKVGAWLEEKLEPIIPDDFDQGKKPFIRPFMIDLASDHYALDIKKARKLLHWEPKHSIKEGLPKLIKALTENPKQWYQDNNLTLPDWMQAVENNEHEEIRVRYEEQFRREHKQNLWARFFIIGFGFWLITSPLTMSYQSSNLFISDIISGVLLVLFGFISLSWRFSILRWVCACIGLWLLFAPLIFWAPTAVVYLNDTLIGTLVIGFSILIPPEIGVAPHAALSRVNVPPGWDRSPSSWFQRLPIIILAFVGFFISRYMAAYQLGHIQEVWDPFFAGNPINAKNGTEEIITSYISAAWPVSDAGLGAMVYLLEILTGLIGGANRWRTMPWIVVLFGILIVPLGAVSITFIIIQPILLNTWCTLCLIAAAAMLIQIPYSINELVATGLFLYRRKKAGRPFWNIFFAGDVDEEEKDRQDKPTDDFEQSPSKITKDIMGEDTTLTWSVVLCLFIGLWLTLTRITLDSTASMANADHLIGSLLITINVIALAETARAIRFFNLFFAIALFITPFAYGASMIATVSSIICGVLLFIFTIPRGAIRRNYGEWNKFIF